jgi:hypothetical protein
VPGSNRKKSPTAFALLVLAWAWCLGFIVLGVTADAQGWRNDPLLMLHIFGPLAMTSLTIAAAHFDSPLKHALGISTAAYMLVLTFGGGLYGFYLLAPAAVILIASSIISWRSDRRHAVS